jgi:hypothetical protein
LTLAFFFAASLLPSYISSLPHTQKKQNPDARIAALQSLPPTYTAHLDGLPGFTANVDYTVTAIASKTKNVKLGIGVSCVSLTSSLYSLPFARAPPPRRLLFVVAPRLYRSASVGYR